MNEVFSPSFLPPPPSSLVPPLTLPSQRSSRSHTLFQMVIESGEKGEKKEGEDGLGGVVKVSLLTLVDLAGSERAQHTQAAGVRLRLFFFFFFFFFFFHFPPFLFKICSIYSLFFIYLGKGLTLTPLSIT